MIAIVGSALAVAAVAKGFGRPLICCITEWAATRRQREALHALERLAAKHPGKAHLVVEVVRAGQVEAMRGHGGDPHTSSADRRTERAAAEQASATALSAQLDTATAGRP